MTKILFYTMSETNITHSDEIHRLFIYASKPTGDRTGLYIIILLCLLIFILIFYLVYNFISYKRYCSSRKKNNLYSYSKNVLSIERKLKIYSSSYEELMTRSYQPPLLNSNFKEIKNTSITNQQYSIKTPLVSDL